MQDHIHYNDRRYKDNLNEKLCQCTSTTKGQAMMMAILLGQRHSLSWVAILDVINLINNLYDSDVLPSSKYKLFKYLSVSEDSFTHHIFCTNCEMYLGERVNFKTNEIFTCMNCSSEFVGKSTSYFVTLNFASQIRNLLQNPDIQEHLQYRYERQKSNDGSVSDIYDGAMYTKLQSPGQPLHYKWNISYTFNTDGCQASKSSKMSMWPIYAMINELPPNLRAKHMLLVGLWAHQKQPNMNLFLKPFVAEANLLATEGVQWQYNGNAITSTVIPICCCVDSAARCCLLSMMKFNGSYGCTFCEHPAETVNGYKKYPISVDVPPNRTDESIRQCMIDYTADKEKSAEVAKGIKGPSVLMNLQYFDLAEGMVPDYMHSVLLGVIKFHTEILLTSVGTAYYIGKPNQLALINRRLTSIVCPTKITRSPRSIYDRRLWKASEWRSWLVWYSLTCLRGILPDKYLLHLALLVTAIQICLQDVITPDMLENARVLLIKYVIKVQKYFGKESMRYNVHLLLHITKSIENWGPLWTHNAFSFENENRLLLQLKTSPYLVTIQIARRYIFYKSIPAFTRNITNGRRYSQFCQNLDNKNKVHFSMKVGDCTLLGSGKKYTLLPEEVATLNETFPINCISYEKIIVNGIRFTSLLYKRQQKSTDSVIRTPDGVKGTISNICCFDVCQEDRSVRKRVIVFVREILVRNDPYLTTSDVTVTHIKRCNVNNTNPLRACDPTSLRDQCILITVDNKSFISEIPRGCLGD